MSRPCSCTVPMISDLTPYTVLNKDIAPQRIAALLCMHDPDRGVVVCHPVPPRPPNSHLALDALHALGKRPANTGWPLKMAHANRAAALWLRAERIANLLLLRADLFTTAALEEFVSLAAGAGTRTWLIFDALAKRNAATANLATRTASRVQNIGRTEKPATHPQTPAEPWPTSSPWLARAAAAATLPPEEFQETDTRIHTALKATSSWITRQDQLDPQALSRFLESITSDPVGRYGYARLAGASSAILQHGYASEIYEHSTPKTPEISKPTDKQAIQIRSHTDPAHAALCALALLTSLDETTITSLTLDQVIDNPPAISVGGCWLAGAAGAALRAHQANQAASGLFAPADPLFTRPQLRHRPPMGENRRCAPKQTKRLDIQLAALMGPLDLTKRQPALSTTHSTLSKATFTTRHNSSLGSCASDRRVRCRWTASTIASSRRRNASSPSEPSRNTKEGSSVQPSDCASATS
jgi:hypothetical protein